MISAIFVGMVMNTRVISKKSEDNNLYNTAIENQCKSTYDSLTIYTSIPASSKSTHKQIDFLDNFEIDKDLFRTN